MARNKDRRERDAAAAKAAATGDPKGGDVKVDIEVEDDQEGTKQASEGEAEATAPAEATYENPEDDPEYAAKVEAAIKAGEAAAEADFKGDAKRLEAERDELAKKLAGVADEIEAAKAEAQASAERLARLQADWDNYRRRTERERVTERERACEGLVTSLLPVIDDLERAVAHAAGSAEGNEAVQQIVDGVSAVHAKVLATLAKQGVEVIDPAGEAFDPNAHQAVGRVEDASAYDETVHDVYQKGYSLAGKVIRPAMVTVTFGGEKRPAPEPEGDASEQDK